MPFSPSNSLFPLSKTRPVHAYIDLGGNLCHLRHPPLGRSSVRFRNGDVSDDFFTSSIIAVSIAMSFLLASRPFRRFLPRNLPPSPRGGRLV